MSPHTGHRRIPRSLRAGLTVAAVAGTAAVTMACSAVSGSASGSAEAAAAPAVQTVMSGLDHPWDVSFFRNGDMLTTQRPGVLTMRTASGGVRTIKAPLGDLFVQSEGGLEGLVVDPTTVHRYFYTCQTYERGGKAVDARVIRWAMSDDGKSATREKTILSGLPVTSGRHSGCRLRFVPGYWLAVGTGDAATGTNPQNLYSLGGKTLRVGANGQIPTNTPFHSKGGNARYVTSYGHRNVQGLAMRPGTSQLWTQEQGTTRDDETNIAYNGGNYGYDPVPGYNESVPMTDLKKFPHAVRAQWSSGSSTVATCGITFLQGSAWGRWNGALAVAELKGEGVRILTLDKAGKVIRQELMPELNKTFGRLRTVQTGPGGALYVTTDNGGKADKVLRVTPHAPSS
ncbi:sorbosone dehydrogenase family protein [Allobranchiibius sp. GilTou73]|uniref:PQQ-dependent sugar dehydrogenase n=1 Tax=Allobranchiibius sp. GilTou73 TaxID=2904523 RepID=UPI001F42B3A3|nr:PQQ-dependent sugar dehydrogenase [Allobranchiibius sp. GilTou73]UIJ33919.1 PQQ-dependent sugar dehydrogenase [Allobranchiibius sp. GilTou73]